MVKKKELHMYKIYINKCKCVYNMYINFRSHNFTEEFDEVEMRGLLTGFWQGFYSLG